MVASATSCGDVKSAVAIKVAGAMASALLVPVTVAVTVLTVLYPVALPTGPRVHMLVVRPAALVVVVALAKEPPPAVTAHMTVMLGTGLLYSSTTLTTTA